MDKYQALKAKMMCAIDDLKMHEHQAKIAGNLEMGSGICLARVLIEEALRNISGSIPQTINSQE